MEENKNSYFGGIRDGLKSLATGLGVTFSCFATPSRSPYHAAGRRGQQ